VVTGLGVVLEGAAALSGAHAQGGLLELICHKKTRSFRH
jgi:hypothetical protein